MVKTTPAAAALRKRAAAEKIRRDADAKERHDHSGARWDRAAADRMAAEAAVNLEKSNDAPPPGNGGELAFLRLQGDRTEHWMVDTVHSDPTMLAADASWERLQLAIDADALTLGVDLAETIGAQNSAEKMLAHQLAGAHRLAMEFMAYAGVTAEVFANTGHRNVGQSVEASRMANTANRLMTTFQSGLQTLHKLRNGGQQTLTVQHVNVSNGGQAVVAGSLDRGRKHER